MVMIKRLHKMSEAQVKREMAAVGLRWLRTDDSLPEQHLLFFEKPDLETLDPQKPGNPA